MRTVATSWAPLTLPSPRWGEGIGPPPSMRERAGVRVGASRAYSALVAVGDGQFVRGEERDDLRALGRDDHLLLDPRRRDAVRGRAIGLDREDHARLELHGLVQGVEPRDDRTLVEPKAEPVAEVEAEGSHLALEADLLRLGKALGDALGGYARLDESDGAVHPVPRLLVGAVLGGSSPSHAERPVVAGAVAHEGLDDVEEGLVAGAKHAVGEVVGMGRAALAGDGVDGLYAVRAHLVESLGRQGHDLVLAHPRLERLEDVLIHAVAHGCRHVEEHDLVGALAHAGLQHHLLAVAHLDAFLLEREEEGRLDHIDADGHVSHALLHEDLLDLSRRPLEKARRWRHRAPHADHARAAVIGEQPWRVEPMVPRRRAEVPHPRLAVAGEQRVADELVPCPLADDGAGDVTDVVLIEHEQGAQARAREGAAHPGQAIGVEPPEIHTLLEVHLHVPGRLDGPVPAVLWVRHFGHVGLGYGSWLASHGASSFTQRAALPLINPALASSLETSVSARTAALSPSGGEGSRFPLPCGERDRVRGILTGEGECIPRTPRADSPASRCRPRRPAARPRS